MKSTGWDDRIFLRLSRYLKLPIQKAPLDFQFHEKNAHLYFDLPTIPQTHSDSKLSTAEDWMQRSKDFKEEELLQRAKSTGNIYFYNLLLAHSLRDYPFSASRNQIILRDPPKFPQYVSVLNQSQTGPDTTTIELCIRFSFSIQDVPSALRNIQLLEQRMTVPSPYYVHLFDGYCMLGDARNAVSMLKKLTAIKSKPHWESVVRLLNLIFTSSSQSMAVEKELKELEMLKDLAKPLNALVKQKLVVGDSRVALRLYKWMRVNNLPTSQAAYDVLVERAKNKVQIPPPLVSTE
jgi:hypothetical protein